MNLKFRWSFVFAIILALGIFLRVKDPAPHRVAGFDEIIYGKYVEKLGVLGLRSYPQMVEDYVLEQSVQPLAFLPPTRVTFLVAAHIWRSTMGGSGVIAVQAVSCIASVLLLLLVGWAMLYEAGPRRGAAVLLLMVFAPTQIFMAQRAFIDGFFSLIATMAFWSFWRLLQNSKSWKWALAYLLSIALLVATKENAAFVVFALAMILLTLRWTKLGDFHFKNAATLATGCVLGALLLIFCSGGWRPLVEVYRLNMLASSYLSYAAATGNGPWFRYLLDILCLSPAIFCLALVGCGMLQSTDKLGLFFLVLLVFSYIPMSLVPGGMNLRYTNYWDFPIRWFAMLPLVYGFPGIVGKRRQILMGALLLVLVGTEYSSYLTLFVDHSVYDPVPREILPALQVF